MSAVLGEALAWLADHAGVVRYERGGIVVVTVRDELTMLDAIVRAVDGDFATATVRAVEQLQERVAARRESRARVAGGIR